MTTPFWCLLLVVFLPYVLSSLGGYYRAKQLGAVDNRHPRAQAAALEGAGARVYAAQQNAWEALPVFSAAVIVAHLAGADPARSAIAAQLFVVTRVLHPVFYVADLATARSAVFLVGLGCCFWLFRLAAVA